MNEELFQLNKYNQFCWYGYYKLDLNEFRQIIRTFLTTSSE